MSKENVIYEEEDHLMKGSEKMIEFYRTISDRLLDWRDLEVSPGHLFGQSKMTATWVYAMLKFEHSKEPLQGLSENVKLSTLLRSDLKSFINDKRKVYFSDLRAAVILIDDSYFLYLAEAFLAMKYGTHWNSFRTH